MTAGANSTHFWVISFGQVLTKLGALVALKASVEADVGGHLKTTPKEQVLFENLFVMVVAQDGQDHGGGWFSSSLLQPDEPVWGTVKNAARAEVFNLVVDLGDGILSDWTLLMMTCDTSTLSGSW